MPFVPGDPWPGTPGGSIPAGWSGYLRFYLRAAIASGRPFTMGDDPNCRLDAGNSMAYFGQPAEGESTWADLSCDCTDVQIKGGSSSTSGILSKAEAGTLVAELWDPESKYDPLNPDSPFVLAGSTRLGPGIPVEAFAEVINNPAAATPTVTKRPLFTGTADRWSQPWTREESERFGRLEATDATKLFVKMNKPEQPAQGQGELAMQRISRIVTYYGWQGVIWNPPTYTVDPLQGTTLAASAWELLNRTLDDQIGMIYVTRDGRLRWTARNQWTARTTPVASFGCGPGLFDIVTEAIPQTFDAALLNTVSAANTGGNAQTATSSSSVARFGEQSYKRTDLGMLNDTAAAAWALFVIGISAYPQTGLELIRLQPDAAPSPWIAWNAALGLEYVTDIIRVLWEAAGYTADVQARIVGHSYKIDAEAFEVEWRLVGSSLVTGPGTFHMGPHANAALDSGFVLA